MPLRLRIATLVLFAGCRPQTGYITTDTYTPGPGLPGGLPVGLPGGTPGGTPTTTSGTSTTTDTLCEQPLPAPPVTWTRHTNFPGTEEFAFDTAGNLINLSESAGLLFSTAYGGTSVVLAPYASSEVAGLRFRATGDTLVVADEGAGSLVDLTLSGSSTVLLGSIEEPNSVAIHRDGWIYTTADDQIWLVDPDGVLAPELQIEIPSTDLDGLVFSNDYSFLYYNSDSDGFIARSRVNADGTLEAYQTVANLPIGFYGELDGMAIDVCDNLYVTATDGRLFRVRPSGSYIEYAELSSPFGMWATAIHFGSGLGGFERSSLYVMNRNGDLWEGVVGVEGKLEPHLLP